MPVLSLQERRAFLYALALFGIGFFFLIEPFLISISLSVILAVLLAPVYLFFVRVFKGRRWLASLTTTFLTFLVLVLPFTIIVIALVNQAINVFAHVDVPSFLKQVNSNALIQEYWLPKVTLLEEYIKAPIDFGEIAANGMKEFARYIYSYSPQVLGRTAGVVFGFFAMHFSIYFLFIEGKSLTRLLLDLSPLSSKYENKLIIEFKNMIYATVYGYLLTALVQATLAGIGFAIVGVKASLVFASMTFFMSLVPILGATSIWLPISLFYFFIEGRTGAGIFLFIYGAFVISGIDNVIKPLIMQEKARIHVLLIFFSLIGGLSLFGPIGILFGPIITALFVACIKIYREDFVTS